MYYDMSYDMRLFIFFSDTYQKSSLLSDIRLQFAVSTDTSWFAISRSKWRVERRVDSSGSSDSGLEQRFPVIFLGRPSMNVYSYGGRAEQLVDEVHGRQVGGGEVGSSSWS